MFTLNDLLDQVECQGNVKVFIDRGCSDKVEEVFSGSDLRQIPYCIACKELAYIYNKDGYTCYEVKEGE